MRWLAAGRWECQAGSTAAAITAGLAGEKVHNPFDPDPMPAPAEPVSDRQNAIAWKVLDQFMLEMSRK